MDERQAKLLTRKQVYPGRVVNLWVHRIALPNGKTTELEVIQHPGASAVVPIDHDGQVVLVRQYRHAAGGWIYEVPAGKLDAGEDPQDCARREVREETGFQAGDLHSLGWIWTTPGFTDEKIWLFAATDLVAAEQDLDDDELLEVVHVPRDQAIEMAVDGRIGDSKSVAALLRLPHFLEG